MKSKPFHNWIQSHPRDGEEQTAYAEFTLVPELNGGEDTIHNVFEYESKTKAILIGDIIRSWRGLS